MPTHNEDIARIFDAMADLLEIGAQNPFRVRAYRNAARRIRASHHDLPGLVRSGQVLPHLPGIGKDLAGKIAEIARTGRCEALEKLQSQIPASLAALLRLPGVGPKRVRLLHEQLGIRDVQGLKDALENGRLEGLPGFGPRLIAQLRDAAAKQSDTPARMLRAEASRFAEPLVDHLRRDERVREVAVAGSYRRGRETVGDLDLVVVADEDAAVIQRFTNYGDVAQVVSAGSTRATVRLRQGLQVDLRLVPAASYGTALHYLTGSKAHNVAVRRRGQARGLKLNEYGVYRNSQRIAGDTEESVYAAVDLPWIPPEIREGQGEIEAAQAGRLPDLVTRDQLRGDLHCHTTASDGQASLEEMAAAAQAQGLEYLAITDHSRSLRIANGLDSERLLAQGEAIDRLNEQLVGLTLLKGCEVDILEDGSLDLPDATLARLDLLIGAVHTRFGLSREAQTNRILRAMDHPRFMILAHPSGRLINKRSGYDVDLERIVRHARDRGCHLELNGNPRRLDLDEVHARMAREEGVQVSIDSDAHSVEGFDNLASGVLQARRGWLSGSDVLNARPLAELRRMLD